MSTKSSLPKREEFFLNSSDTYVNWQIKKRPINIVEEKKREKEKKVEIDKNEERWEKRESEKSEVMILKEKRKVKRKKVRNGLHENQKIRFTK